MIILKWLPNLPISQVTWFLLKSVCQNGTFQLDEFGVHVLRYINHYQGLGQTDDKLMHIVFLFGKTLWFFLPAVSFLSVQ